MLKKKNRYPVLFQWVLKVLINVMDSLNGKKKYKITYLYCVLGKFNGKMPIPLLVA